MVIEQNFYETNDHSPLRLVGSEVFFAQRPCSAQFNRHAIAGMEQRLTDLELPRLGGHLHRPEHFSRVSDEEKSGLTFARQHGARAAIVSNLSLDAGPIACVQSKESIRNEFKLRAPSDQQIALGNVGLTLRFAPRHPGKANGEAQAEQTSKPDVSLTPRQTRHFLLGNDIGVLAGLIALATGFAFFWSIEARARGKKLIALLATGLGLLALILM